MMWRAALLVAALGACSSAKPAPTIVVPDISHGCHRPAPDPRPMSALHTLDELKQWSAATAHARDIDRLSLLECERKLDEAVDALDGIRAQVVAGDH